jgi:hypothetical protein
MKNTIAVCLFIACSSAFGQTAVPPNMRSQFTLDQLRDQQGIGVTDILYGVPLPPGETIGDSYLDKKWNVGRILLYERDKIIEGYPVRYDITDDVLEIRSRTQVKVIETRKINSVVWIDSLSGVNRFLVNGRAFQLNGTRLTGLIEVLSDGGMPLLKRTTVVEKEPDYNAALHVGSRDKKLLRKHTFYYSVAGGLTKIGSKTSLLPAFGDHAKEMEEFIKTNKIDLDNERSLTLLFDHYNSKFLTEAN